MKILSEIYKFIFISSIIFIVYIFGNLAIKIYGRFKLKADTRFVLTTTEKLLLWASIALFFTYLF
jgi:uncharacterized membrane protein